MSIEVTCPTCRAVLPAPETMAGQRIRCADCQSLVDVPKPTEQPSELQPIFADETPTTEPTRKKPRAEWDDELTNEQRTTSGSVLSGGAVAWLVIVAALSLVGLAIIGMAVLA
jgi:hypothetical protein